MGIVRKILIYIFINTVYTKYINQIIHQRKKVKYNKDSKNKREKTTMYLIGNKKNILAVFFEET